MKKQILLNGITNDIAPTLLAGYYKYGVATLITGNFGTSGGGAILEIETMQELINTDSNGISRTIVAQYGAKGYSCLLRNDGFGITGVMEEIEPKINLVGQYDSSQNSRVIDTDGVSYCMANGHKDGMPKIIEPNVLRAGRTEQCKQLRKMNGDKGMKFNQGNKEYSPRTDGVSNTLSTSTKDNMLAMPELRMEDGCMVDKEGRKYRIRKLTPTECFRLQDVSDEDIEKIRSYRDDETAVICDANGEPIMNMDFDKPSKNARKITITVNGEQREYYSSQLIWKNKGKGISKTAQYKLAGNSICVAPMYHIFRKLFIEKECENQQLELF